MTRRVLLKSQLTEATWVGTMAADKQAGAPALSEGDVLESSVPLLPVVVLTAERTVGEAVAAGLSRRGCDARALPLEDAMDAQADAWVLDVSAAIELGEVGFASVIGERTGRVVLLSGAGRADVGVEVDAVVRFSATFDVLLAAIRGHGDPDGEAHRHAGDSEQRNHEGRSSDVAESHISAAEPNHRFGSALATLPTAACL